ncbi:MAG: DMT family transporter [Oscillospiraceae bacterium]
MLKMDKPGRLFVDFVLIVVAVVWGSGFTLSTIALNGGFPVSLILCLRFVIGTIVMVLLFGKQLSSMTKEEFKYGCITGVILFFAFFLETTGLKYTTPSKNAFLACSNVILVPFVYWIFSKVKPPLITNIAGFVCFAGIAVLSYSPDMGFYLNFGDIISICSAFGYAIHICYLSAALQKCKNFLVINILQLGVVGFFGTIFFLIKDFKNFDPATLKTGLLPCIIMGIFSTAFCYCLQCWAQKHASPTEVSIILSLELVSGSVISILAGFDKVTLNLIVGGIIIFTAILMTQLDFTMMAKKFNKG